MSTPEVVVVGGGFAGCAAAVAAAKAGASVQVLERTDMLAGAGLRAGRMNYNGKYVAAEEGKAMGFGEIFEALESIVLHRANIVDEENVYVYDVCKVDKAMRQALQKAGVRLRLVARVTNVEKNDGHLTAVKIGTREKVAGDVFLDCTGSFGGIDICTKYGKGCVMCVHRCPVFGNRVSIATKAGAREIPHTRPDGTPGRLSPSITVFKGSLSPELQQRIEKEGAFSIRLPQEMIDYSKETKNFPGIRGKHQIEHLNLVNTGPVVKLPAIGYFNLEDWRKIPGFENVLIEHPMGGAVFNFVNHTATSPRDNTMQTRGFANLFEGGEKSGDGGIAECIATGALAGYNAVRAALGKELITLPRSTALGDFIATVGEAIDTPNGLSTGHSMGHLEGFERIKKLGLYDREPGPIRKRIEKEGLKDLLAQRLVN